MSRGTRLKRQLGLIDVFAISTGAMFSSGFFLLPGIAYAYAGPWMVAAYLLSALLVVPAMLSVAELASAMPRAGGAYYYMDRSMGPLVGTIAGLGTWVAMSLKITFALIGIGAYVGLFLQVDIRALAVPLAVLFTAINIVGAKESARLQRWMVYVLLAILATFLAAGFVDIGLQGRSWAVQSGLPETPDTSLDGLLGTVGLVFVSYAGLTKVAGVAEEVDNPQRNILLGMLLSLGVAVTAYVLGTWVLVMVLPPEVLFEDLAPIATGARQVMGPAGVVAVSVAAIAAFASTANAGILSASRYLLAMGRDRLVSRAFEKVGASGTPVLAVVVTGLFVVTCLLLFDVVTVAKLASAFQLLMFALLNAAVIVMRESRIETYDPAVRSPLYPWTQLLGIFLALFLIVEMGRLPMLFTLGMVGLGAAWFFAYAGGRVVRSGAILHWFERLGRQRFDPLEQEMWGLLKEAGLREHDPYDELLRRAHVVDLHEPATYADVVQMTATRLSARVAVDDDHTVSALLADAVNGPVPVADGVVMSTLRAPGQATHELVIVRSALPIAITGEEHAEALFFLVSPDKDPGQHLRLLAKLATQAEQPDFLTHWRSTDAGELRRLMTDDPLDRLARRLTRRLSERPWRPSNEPDRFESILVMLPPGAVNPETLGFVTRLAARHQARVTLGSEAAEPLEAAAAALREQGVRVRTVAWPRPMWLAAIHDVLGQSHDLLVVPAEAGRGFGSAIQHLLRKCPCPVWVVRPERGTRIPRLLAAIDVESSDEPHSQLNDQILALAGMLATDHQAELHLVHAWGSGPADHAFEATVEGLLRGHHIDPARTRLHFVEGEPSEVIAGVVEAERIDLIVMGTVSRTGVAGFFIGNTAETVLQAVECAVLTAKPPGFETPVR